MYYKNLKKILFKKDHYYLDLLSAESDLNILF